MTKSGLGNLTRWESEDRAREGGEEQSAKVETHLYGMTGVELYDSKVRDCRRMLLQNERLTGKRVVEVNGGANGPLFL